MTRAGACAEPRPLAEDRVRGGGRHPRRWKTFWKTFRETLGSRHAPEPRNPEKRWKSAGKALLGSVPVVPGQERAGTRRPCMATGHVDEITRSRNVGIGMGTRWKNVGQASETIRIGRLWIPGWARAGAWAASTPLLPCPAHGWVAPGGGGAPGVRLPPSSSPCCRRRRYTAATARLPKGLGTSWGPGRQIRAVSSRPSQWTAVQQPAAVPTPLPSTAPMHRGASRLAPPHRARATILWGWGSDVRGPPRAARLGIAEAQKDHA
eukprot:gene16790-biopygen4188